MAGRRIQSRSARAASRLFLTEQYNTLSGIHIFGIGLELLYSVAKLHQSLELFELKEIETANDSDLSHFLILFAQLSLPKYSDRLCLDFT
jgi:hypothetical protein